MSKIFNILICSILLMTSCEDNGYWDEGEEISAKVEIINFQTLKIESIFDVVLVADSVNFGIIKCGKNLMKNVKFESHNNILNISQISKTNWTRSYRHTTIELHYKNISNIQIRNSIKIISISPISSEWLSIEDYSELSELDIVIDCKHYKMAVYNDNCGLYKVKGRTLSSNLTLNGSCHFRTDSLEADSVNVFHNGIGDCFVNASNILTGSITKNGTIRYKNRDKLKVEIEIKKGSLSIF